MDINEEILALIAKRKEIGERPAPKKGGSYNNIIDYRRCEEKILEKCLDAFEKGMRFEVQ